MQAYGVGVFVIIGSKGKGRNEKTKGCGDILWPPVDQHNLYKH